MTRRRWFLFGIYSVLVGFAVVWLSGAPSRPIPVVPTEPYCVELEGVGRVFTLGGASADDLLTFRASIHNATALMTNNLPPEAPMHGFRPTRIVLTNLGDEPTGTEGEMVCYCGTYDTEKAVCEGQCASCEHCYVPSKGGNGKGIGHGLTDVGAGRKPEPK